MDKRRRHLCEFLPTVVLISSLVQDSMGNVSLLTMNLDHSEFYPKGMNGFIPQNYSPLIPPPSLDGNPINVEFSVLIMNVRDIQESSQELSLEMNLRVHWLDIRLQNLTGDKEYLVLNPNLIDKSIWRPDVFVDHVKSVPIPFLLTKPASLRVYVNGAVRYSARLTVVMSCLMNFLYYPADTQRCNIDLKSYAYPSTILILNWLAGGGKGDMGVSFGENLTLPNFKLGLDTPSVFSTVSDSGIYSGLRFTISLRRKMSYHLLQTYFPSAMFIAVSWLTFIIPQNNGALVPSSLTYVVICMTCLLTVTTMFAGIRQNTPTVSYVKAIDIWMVVSMFFVFLCLGHHSVTMKLRHMKINKSNNQKKKSWFTYSGQDDDRPVEEDPTVLGVAYRVNGKDQNDLQIENIRNTQCGSVGDINKRYSTHVVLQPEGQDAATRAMEDYKLLGNKIRRIFALGTPILFGIFNIIYWPWLLKESGYYD